MGCDVPFCFVSPHTPPQSSPLKRGGGTTSFVLSPFSKGEIEKGVRV